MEIWINPDKPELGKKTVKVWPVCGWAEGDIPILEKIANSVGHGAKAACLRCALRGVTVKEANTVRCDLSHT